MSYRKLALRRERNATAFLGLAQLACALIVWRQMRGATLTSSVNARNAG